MGSNAAESGPTSTSPSTVDELATSTAVGAEMSPPARRNPRERRRGAWLVPGAVALLLCFYVVVALLASRQKGLSYDEGEQIATGYNIWRNHDYRMEAANGDLVKRWATLPLLISKPAFVPLSDPTWRGGQPYVVAFRFFFTLGNDPASLLFQCRAMVALLGVATGLLVFCCARQLFGRAGGLIALALFVSSPSMLAFGGMVSTEMTACLTLLGCAWSSWRLLQGITWRRLAASLVFTALLVLSKPTAIIMLPVTAFLIAIRLARAQPLDGTLWGHWRIRRRSRQMIVFGALMIAHVAFAWAAIWAAYGFRYAASPNPADAGIVFRTQPEDPIDANIVEFLTWSAQTHFLPEGYLHGIRWLLAQNESQVAFMNGHWKYGGWRTFFPYAMWVKTPPALIALLVLAALAWLWGRHATQDGLRGRRASLYHAVPFVALIVVYFAVAITWDLNIGFRHVLPIYPAAYVLAGAVVLLWRRSWAAKAAIVSLVAWQFGGSLQVYPHFLAYFSPVAGGPQNGYQHLVDSSLDWGMDLPGLKRWLDHHDLNHEPFYFAYFGTDNPDAYGIKSFRLPGRPDWRAGHSFPLVPGYYAISATLLESIGTKTVGPWNQAFEKAYWRSLETINTYDVSLTSASAHAALLAKYPQSFWDQQYALFDSLRFGRLCAWLRHHRPPEDHVGYSILIWHLTEAEIAEIGLGAPAELAAAPLRR